MEVRRRDDIISQLQSRLREYEPCDRMTPINEKDLSGSSNEQPFMVNNFLFPVEVSKDSIIILMQRGDSLDTIFASSPPSEYEMQKRQRVKKKFSTRQDSSRSWDESSDPESFEIDQLSPRATSPRNSNNFVVSNLTGNIMSDSVVLNIEDETEEDSASGESQSEEEDEDEDDMDDGTIDDLHSIGNDWEVRMLAAELKKRQSLSEAQADFDENDGLLRRRKRRSDTDTDASEPEAGGHHSRPRAASLDQHNLRKQQYKCRGVFKAMSFDRDKDQL